MSTLALPTGRGQGLHGAAGTKLVPHWSALVTMCRRHGPRHSSSASTAYLKAARSRAAQTPLSKIDTLAERDWADPARPQSLDGSPGSDVTLSGPRASYWYGGRRPPVTGGASCHSPDSWPSHSAEAFVSLLASP